MGKASVVRGLIFAGLSGVCWGFSGACAQLLTSQYDLSIPWLLCVRLFFGSLFFLILAYINTRDKLKSVTKDKKLLVLLLANALLGVLAPQFFYLSSIAYNNAGIATVLERVGLVLILIYTCVRLSRGPKKTEILGLVLALTGVFLIATEGRIGNFALSPEGAIFGALTAVVLLLTSVLPLKLLDAWGNFVTSGLSLGLACIAAVAIVQPWNIQVNLDFNGYFFVGVMVVVGTICSYFFFFQGVKEAGPMRAGLMGCTEPISATAFAALWLGTSFAPPVLAGMALIIVMMFFIRDTGE